MKPSTHTAMLFSAVTCLGLAVLLTGLVADAHHINVSELPDHGATPIAVTILVYMSVLLNLWPAGVETWVAARQRRVHWGVAAVAAALAFLWMGWPLIGASAALVLSLAMRIWPRHGGVLR